MVDCPSYWEKFQAIQSSQKCEWHMDDYKPVTDMVKLDIPKDLGVLWSQTGIFVSKITFKGYRLFSIADTLIGLYEDSSIFHIAFNPTILILLT